MGHESENTGPFSTTNFTNDKPPIVKEQFDLLNTKTYKQNLYFLFRDINPPSTNRLVKGRERETERDRERQRERV